MKTYNKKIIIVSMLVLTLILFSTSTFAKPFTDAFRGGLLEINNFFTNEGYKPYSAAIDFFFFALLFIAIYMMGARYAFKEIKRPEQVIVILLGLMTSFLLVIAGFSSTMIIPYIHWLLYTLLFALYYWLLKIKNKFLRFLAALLATLLTIGLAQGLFDGLTAPDTGGFFSSFGKSFGGFGGLGDAFKSIQFPELPSAPGIPDYLSNLFGPPSITPTGPEPLPITTTQKIEPVKKQGVVGGLPWWVWLLILAIAVFLIYRYGNRLRVLVGGRGAGEERRVEEEEERREELTIIQKIIEQINQIIEIKREILSNIMEILEKKKDATRDFLDAYHKMVTNPNFDPAFLLDKESEQYKELQKESQEILDLLFLEIKLEYLLIKLRFVEEILSGTSPELVANLKLELKKLEKEGNQLVEEARREGRANPHKLINQIFDDIQGLLKNTNLETGKLIEWRGLIREYYAKVYQATFGLSSPFDSLSPDEMGGADRWYKEALGNISDTFKRLMDVEGPFTRVKGLVPLIKIIITRFFLLTRRTEEVESEMKRLINVHNFMYNLREMRGEKWKIIGEKDADSLKEYFEDEEANFFKLIYKNVHLEMRCLKYIRELLKFLESKRKSFTQLQELRISIKDPADQNKWIDVTEEAADPAIGIHEQLLRVSTNFVEGIPPFKVVCYVNGVKKAEQDVDKKVGIEPVVEFFNIEIPADKLLGKKEIGRLPIEIFSGIYRIAYRIVVSAVSAKYTYKRISSKNIEIYITRGIPPTQHPEWPDSEGNHNPTPPEEPILPVQPVIPPQPRPGPTRHVNISIDLSPHFMPIKNQENSGACAAFAGASIAEYSINRLTQRILLIYELSELFLWYNIRDSNEKDINTGVYTLDTVPNSLLNQGICFDDFWPWNPVDNNGVATKFAQLPHDIGRGDPYSDALKKIIPSFTALPPNDPDVWVDELLKNNPVIIAIFVDEGFKQTGKQKKNFYGTQTGNTLGGHALVIVGFTTNFRDPNTTRRIPAFKIRNSWGKDWGENGYIWIPHDLLPTLLINVPYVFENLTLLSKELTPSKERPTSAERTVRITNPANGARFYLDENITFEATINLPISNDKKYIYIWDKIDEQNKTHKIAGGFAERNSVITNIPASHRWLGVGKNSVIFRLIDREQQEYFLSNTIEIYIERRVRLLPSGRTEPEQPGMPRARVMPQTPNFSLTANPNLLTIHQGGQGNSTLTVTSLNGFNREISLFASARMITQSIIPTLSNDTIRDYINGTATSTLTINVNPDTPVGVYVVLLVGVSVILRHTVSLNINVVEPTQEPNMQQPSL